MQVGPLPIQSPVNQLHLSAGWAGPGGWLEFTVDVIPGIYDVETRVASELTGGTFHLEVDGIDKTGPITFSRTFGWQNWVTVNVEDVIFDSGVQTLRLVFESGSFAESFPAATDQLWPPRDSCVGVVGEHEVVSAQGSTCHAGSRGGLVVERGE